MTIKLLIKQHFDFLSLKGGWTGSSESIHVKILHCWKSHVAAQNWASTRENLSSMVCDEHRRRPACASAQSDQSLCYSLFGKNNIWPCYGWNFNFLASLCSLGDRFETRFDGNPEDRFSRDEAQIYFYFQLLYHQHAGQVASSPQKGQCHHLNIYN